MTVPHHSVGKGFIFCSLAIIKKKKSEKNSDINAIII